MAGTENAVAVLDDRLTVNRAAALAEVHPATIRRWLSEGILKHTKTQTGRVRIEEEDLKTVLALG